jgi:hypothetical protein
VNQNADKVKSSEMRNSAKTALLQLMEPLAGFVSDSGLSAGEFQTVFKNAAVRSAAARQLQVSNRINVSGIAATTGIPRAEISRILKVNADTFDIRGNNNQQSTNRILAAWHEDPKFTAPNGQPAELRIYGRGVTFETLVKKYGRGIPTRAVLDELIRSGAIELLDNQKVFAKTSMVIERGMSARVIKAFGDRARELLSTMLDNMRQPESPKFIASISDAAVSTASLPLFRKELATRGSDFLAEVREALLRGPNNRFSKRVQQKAVSVTVFYYEAPDKLSDVGASRGKRRNFRRVS